MKTAFAIFPTYAIFVLALPSLYCVKIILIYSHNTALYEFFGNKLSMSMSMLMRMEMTLDKSLKSP
jgi:hypothetical protein